MSRVCGGYWRVKLGLHEQNPVIAKQQGSEEVFSIQREGKNPSDMRRMLAVGGGETMLTI